MKGRFWIVSAVVAYLAVMGCVMWPSEGSGGRPTDFAEGAPTRAAVPLTGLPYRGMDMQVQRIDRVSDYTRGIDYMASIGFDTVLLVVDSKQETTSSTRIFLDMRQAPSPEKLGELIRYAKSKKLRVILMPIVLPEVTKASTDWRGTIHPELWEDWWDSYRDMLHHYAVIAEQSHADVFSVGSELVSTESKLEEWTRTIRQVRKDFHGQLIYSANWDHYTSVPFWDQLDLIGMNSYYKLGNNSQVSVGEIVNRWHDIQKPLLAFQKRIGKPLIFTEVGWCSLGNAASEPWDYTVTTAPLDLDLQRRLYEGFFDAWHGVPGFGGFMIWAWVPTGGGPEDRGYTPAGKPAEQVLRQWLAKPAWKVQ